MKLEIDLTDIPYPPAKGNTIPEQLLAVVPVEVVQSNESMVGGGGEFGKLAHPRRLPMHGDRNKVSAMTIARIISGDLPTHKSRRDFLDRIWSSRDVIAIYICTIRGCEIGKNASACYISGRGKMCEFESSRCE